MKLYESRQSKLQNKVKKKSSLHQFLCACHFWHMIGVLMAIQGFKGFKFCHTVYRSLAYNIWCHFGIIYILLNANKF